MPDQGAVSPWLSLLLGPLGLTVGLLVFGWLLLTERLVPGTRLGRTEAKLDRALGALERAARATARATDLAERAEKGDRETG